MKEVNKDTSKVARILDSMSYEGIELRCEVGPQGQRRISQTIMASIKCIASINQSH